MENLLLNEIRKFCEDKDPPLVKKKIKEAIQVLLITTNIETSEGVKSFLSKTLKLINEFKKHIDSLDLLFTKFKVFNIGNSWWFTDDTGYHRGPYNTEEIAMRKAQSYYNWLNK